MSGKRLHCCCAVSARTAFGVGARCIGADHLGGICSIITTAAVAAATRNPYENKCADQSGQWQALQPPGQDSCDSSWHHLVLPYWSSLTGRWRVPKSSRTVYLVARAPGGADASAPPGQRDDQQRPTGCAQGHQVP